jgi:hypothetical protein
MLHNPVIFAHLSNNKLKHFCYVLFYNFILLNHRAGNLSRFVILLITPIEAAQ